MAAFGAALPFGAAADSASPSRGAAVAFSGLHSALGGHSPPAPPGERAATLLAAQQQAAMQTGSDVDRGLERDAGYFQNSGFGRPEASGDVDVTVMAYAQWLSEIKQQATNTRYQQQAELDLMRDAINANNGELVDFKRHSSQVVQQLQGQVTELRAKLSDAFAELAQQTRQRTEVEQRTGNVIHGLQQAVSTRQLDIDAKSRGWTDQMDRLSSEVESKLQTLESDVGNIKRALGSSQEQTIMKFSEVDKAMSIFHGNINGARQELGDTKEDWKKSQDLLGQAISTLSQDLADFQKHASTVMNKLQSDAYHSEELGRDIKDRMSRIEAQLNGIQHSVYSTTNELILMKDDRAPPMMRTPQNRRASPRADDASSSRVMDRNASNSTLLESIASLGAGGSMTPPLLPFSSATAVSASAPAGLQPALASGSMGLRPQVTVMAPMSGNGSIRSPLPEASSARLGSPYVAGGSQSPVTSVMLQHGALGMGLPSAPRLPAVPSMGAPTPPAGGGIVASTSNFGRSPTPTTVMRMAH